ncbi:hypothetical protein [Paraburkholderia sp. BL21I4N1]|uniref:hypothetical protein n=1 Tax=Paraburkholderia sp. BL21I4N1 TaxID=1938801 RepID=UPI000CFBB35C|nr:hypothetical protein [Paraburkholderia sp. BL21I4N1]PQV47534.1 hypothetical protein B0G83_11080 [Paraburkholderia sp. BL21I4N1]
MSKSPKSVRAALRPSVDAIQYEKLALSAFRLIERQIDQLDKLLTLATSIYQNPAITLDERSRQRTLLGLWIETGEDYRQEVEVDRELYGIIALDAKDVPQMHLTARHATELLTQAAQEESDITASGGASRAIPSKRGRSKTALRRAAVTH